MNGELFIEALKRLRSKYRSERIQLWVTLHAGLDHEPDFTASVGGGSGEAESVFGWDKHPAGAVENLIAKAGDRNPEVLRQRHIAKLREELAKLEAEAPPEKLAEVVAECEKSEPAEVI